MARADDKFPTSRSSRFLKLGALSGKIGSTYLRQAMAGVFADAETKTRSLLEAHVTNATRVARTFGELKGAVMKVGQMMSLHEDLLPEEMRDILRGLQSHAPPVEFDRMLPVLKAELGPALDQFAAISPEAYRSASIGQVHRGRLKRGAEVVLKIQYPGVDEMVESDLKNVGAFAHTIKTVTPIRADLGKFLREIRGKLTEELDYRIELANLLEFRRRFADDPRFIVPRPYPELCTQRVLTTEFCPGSDADTLCTAPDAQDRRDRIGTYLVDALLRQIFEFRTLQADPNFANFAFTDDDRVILFDFGCVKRLTAAFVAGLRQLARDALLRDYDRLPADLAGLGYINLGRQALPAQVYVDYAEAICGGWRGSGSFDFGKSAIRNQLVELNLQHWRELLAFDAPAEALLVERAFAGTYGNLRKLGARVPMRALLERRVLAGLRSG